MIPLGVLAQRQPATTGGAAVTDSFDRADSTTTLGTTDTGQTWTYHAASGGSSTWGIRSNAAYKVSGSAYAVALIDLESSDMTAHCDLYVDASPRYPGVGVRCTPGTASGYFAWIGTSNRLQLVRRTSTETQTLLTANVATVDYSAWNDIDISATEEATGTRVRVYLDGIEVDTYLDTLTGRPNGTHAGLFSYAGGEFDNFTAEAI